MTSSATLLDVRTDVRNHLDESTARYWTDAELTRWINEGMRDMARRAEVLQQKDTSIVAVPGTPRYPLAANTIRVHRVEFVPTGSTQIYPVEGKTYDELDQYWGLMQAQTASYPSFYCLWGIPGGSGLQIQFYPVPSQAGNFNVYYYRMPLPAAGDGDLLDIPEGWQDLLVLYAEFVAKRKLRDPTWQEAKQLYDASLENMINVTREYTDNARSFVYRGNSQPAWLYEFNDF